MYVNICMYVMYVYILISASMPVVWGHSYFYIPGYGLCYNLVLTSVRL